HMQIQDVNAKQQKVALLRDELLKPNLTPEAEKLTEAQLKAAEADLAKTFESTASYISSSKMDISAGSGGHAAMSTLFGALGALKDATALRVARGGLKKVATQSEDP